MLLRRALLAFFGLWVGLGIVLAPAMPGMASGTSARAAAPAMGNMLEHAEHGGTQHEVAGHHKAARVKTASWGQHDAEPEPSGHDHRARCVLCVVGAGMLTLIVGVMWASSPARAPTANLRPFAQPTRFRHFRSRAPPAVVVR